jgi:hypothetical protein
VPIPGHLLKLSQIEFMAGSARKVKSNPNTGRRLRIAHFWLVAARPIFDFLGFTLEEGDVAFGPPDLSLAIVTIISLFFECFVI